MGAKKLGYAMLNLVWIVVVGEVYKVGVNTGFRF